MSLSGLYIRNLTIVSAIQSNYLIFVYKDENNSFESGVYALKFEKNYFDISPKDNFKNYLYNNKILIYSLTDEQNLAMLKVKGNDNVLVVGSAIKSSKDTTIALDIMNSTESFKRCQSEIIDGEIQEIDILIPDNSKEGAELIYTINYKIDTNTESRLNKENEEFISSSSSKDRLPKKCDTKYSKTYIKYFICLMLFFCPFFNFQRFKE